MSTEEDKENEIERLALKVKNLRLDADACDAGGAAFEEESKEVFAQLVDKISEPLMLAIKKYIYKKNWQNLVSESSVCYETCQLLYEGIRNYNYLNFMGWAFVRAKWVASKEFKKVKLPDEEVYIDPEDLEYRDNAKSWNKIVKKKLLQNYKSTFENQQKENDIRDFLEALQTHFCEIGKEILYKILALRGKFLDEESQKVIGRDLKNKIPFKRIAYELGEFHADSNDKEIKAAQERVRKWYHKAVKIAEEFTSNYYKPLPMNQMEKYWCLQKTK